MGVKKHHYKLETLKVAKYVIVNSEDRQEKLYLTTTGHARMLKSSAVRKNHIKVCFNDSDTASRYLALLLMKQTGVFRFNPEITTE